jgi:mycobactin peptide synthetase MbtE
VLDAAEVGRYAEFFNLGGDSILAVRIAARARDAGMPLTPRMVFEHPVLRELAAAVDAKSEAETEPQDTQAAHHAPMSTSGLSAEELAALTSSWGDQP